MPPGAEPADASVRFGTGDRVVIIGGSIAGLSAAQELRRLGFGGRITVVDSDEQAPYRRPEVSKSMLALLEVAPSTLITWPDDLEVERLSGHRAEALDTARRIVSTTVGGGGRSIAYDGLVIACGCESRSVLARTGSDRIHSLRSMADSLRLRDPFRAAHTVAVVGGGFIGLEVAALASSLGKRATVIELAGPPLRAPLGVDLSDHLLGLHQAAGTEFVLGETVTEIDARATGVGLRTSGGHEVVADLVVEAVGSRPSTGWLHGSGLTLDAGVVGDATCAAVGVEDVVIAGDVAVWFNPRYGRRMRVEHWTNAMEQGEYAAARLLGCHDPGGFAALPYFWSTQGAAKVQSLGSSAGHDAAQVVRAEGASMLVEFRDKGRLVAAAGVNTGRDVMRYRAALLAQSVSC